MKRLIGWVNDVETVDLAAEARATLESGDLAEWARIIQRVLFGDVIETPIPTVPPHEGADANDAAGLHLGIPVYAMVLRPTDDQAAGWHQWVSGYHLRYHQNTVSVNAVMADLDRVHALGRKAGVVIAVHSEQSGPHTKYVRKVGDRLIPDYWSDKMFREWVTVRGKIIPRIKDHPALAWIGGDFGMDDESWPTKPWDDVPADLRWRYAVRYQQAMWVLARLAEPVPVLAQAATMFKQGLDILFFGNRAEHSPQNLGFKFNGFKPQSGMAPGLEERIKPYWEWCKINGRMVALEPGMVPTGDVETDAADAIAMVGRAREWGAAFLNLQRGYLEALDKFGPRG